MKRIGKTDDGGIIVEMGLAEMTEIAEACATLCRLFDGFSGSVIVPPPAVPVNTPPPAPDSGVFHPNCRCADATPTRLTKPVLRKKPVKHVAHAKKVSGGLLTRTCLRCGKRFEPRRKDQRCCSRDCRDHLTPAQEKASTAANKGVAAAVISRPTELDRLDLIRAAAKRVEEKRQMETPDPVEG